MRTDPPSQLLPGAGTVGARRNYGNTDAWHAGPLGGASQNVQTTIAHAEGADRADTPRLPLSWYLIRAFCRNDCLGPRA